MTAKRRSAWRATRRMQRPRRATLRIALISEHASPLASLGGVDAGGQNVYVDKVARQLVERGHEVDVFTRRDDPALPPIVEVQPDLRVVHVGAGPAEFVAKEEMLPLMPAFADSMRRFMAEQRRYDLLHANFFMSGLVGMRLKARLDLPLVMTFHALGLVRREHQGDSDAFPAERIEIERRIVAMADCLIAECPQDRSDLRRLYGASPQRIATVPCGVDLDEFAPLDRARARRTLGLGADEFVVLQLGRLVPRKGIDNVIRAVAAMPERSRVRLLVVGGDAGAVGVQETPEGARLASIAAQCGIADRVTFAGHRQRGELALIYAACDVFVTTPWYEPFGITPLEAMASARPVVGSAVGGIQHTVVDRVTGFLVPPHDPAALAERLTLLQAAPAVGERMGRAGRQRVESRFTWQRVADELATVYAEVSERPARIGALASSWLPIGRAAASSIPFLNGSLER